MRRFLVLPAALLAVLALLTALAAGPRPQNSFHFSILGDRTGAAQPEVYERVWREIALLGPSFVINVGDTIQGGNDDQAAWQWAEVARVWERHKHFPLYLVPGNHDIWSDASRRLFQKVAGRPPQYSFDYQNAHFTVLDNSRTRELTEEHLRFLEADLQRHRDRAPKFVFFHVPNWLVFLKLGSGEFPLHQLCRKYGVNYVVSGHGHVLTRLERDGVVYLEVGSSGAGSRPRAESAEYFRRGHFYHHVWVWVRGGKAQFTVKELDGRFGQGRMFSAEAWGPDGPKFDPADPAAADLSTEAPPAAK
ncbi:MAG: hypothetical protein FJW34_22100 [Acidobacteria bacterium]|nr:hypothetical protein [Acidobacteriota bacterium]